MRKTIGGSQSDHRNRRLLRKGFLEETLNRMMVWMGRVFQAGSQDAWAQARNYTCRNCLMVC